MKILVIDSNALGHVVKHATKELSFRGDKTGVIFGFIRKLFKIQSIVMANKVIFCWDGNKDKLFRKEVFPDYKKSSGEIDPEAEKLESIARPQFAKLRLEVLPKLGFKNNILIDGLEADDSIAQIVTQYEREEDQIIIVSRDNDLHQLLNSNKVYLFDPVKLGYFSASSFWNKWGIEPSEWEFVKAIAGCAGDGVPGIPRVKEKTAIKFLKGELKNTTQAHKAITKGLEICLRNMRLVKLPWESTPQIKILSDNLSLEGFTEMCVKYGFVSYLEGEKSNEFKHLFMDIENV